MRSFDAKLDLVEKNLEVLAEDFYARPTLVVARSLLGCRLWRRTGVDELLFAPIVEVEAYTRDDPASHAYRGPTERAKIMFGPPGVAYVYFIYGMYHCLNVVTEPDGVAGAVLIRALGMQGGDGPGKLCRTWQIDKSKNGVNLMNRDSELFITTGTAIDDFKVEVSPRIGLKVATERPWRFFIAGHPSVSQSKGRSSAAARP